MKLYRVKDWKKIYENNRTRELKHMAWVPVPNSHDGDGYTALVCRKDGPQLFGAWVVILQVASRCGERGTLLRDNGTPHDSASIARMTRFPESTIKEALNTLSSTECGWLEIIGDEELEEIPQCGAGFPQDDAPKSHPTDEERNGTERKEQNNMRAIDERVAAEIYEAYPKKVGKPKAMVAIGKAVKAFGAEVVLKATKAYALARSTEDPQFTPLPATWFNQHRFNDDPMTWKGQSQTPSLFAPQQPLDDKAKLRNAVC